jgi:tetratricopeptide (TPR) repeat protein
MERKSMKQIGSRLQWRSISGLALLLAAALISVGGGQREYAVADPAAVNPAARDAAARYAELGQSLRGRGLTEDAEAALRVSILLDPVAAPAHFGLAELLLDLGRTDEAEAELRRALQLDPDDPTSWGLFGQVLFIRQNWHEAAAAYRVAVQLAPSDPGYRLMQRETERRARFAPSGFTPAAAAPVTTRGSDTMGFWVIQTARWLTVGLLAVAGAALIFPLLGGAFLLLASPLQRLRGRG